MKRPMSDKTIKFLRVEAKKIWKGLPPNMKTQLTEKGVFARMKKTWKMGNKLSPDIRQGIFDNNGT